MPEAPDLQVLKGYLAPRVEGETITETAVLRPLVLRNLIDQSFVDHIRGRQIQRLERQGKLMIFHLAGGFSLVVSPMLTGEIVLADPEQRVLKSTILTMDLSVGSQLRYIDVKRMGQIYYVASDGLGKIKRIENQGPDVLDEPATLSEFRASLKRFRGEIKGVLTRGQLVAGIGNAYADEVLWDAGIYPFRKVSRFSADEIDRLHTSTYRVPNEAVSVLSELFGKNHPRKERKFLSVHGKAGRPCPNCRTSISSVKSRQKDTNFCRKCQPGNLFE